MGATSIMESVTDFVGGGLFKEIKEAVMAYFPPDMSPQQKAEAENKVQQMLFDKQTQAGKMLNDAAVQIDKRIAEQEGTAADLNALGWLGKPIVFLRGCQRPAWGFATFWIDYKWFFEAHQFTEQQQTALIIINVLVLGFLFGERAVLNLQPLIEKVFAAKA